MKFPLFCIFLLAFAPAYSQHYYKDLVMARQLMDKQHRYKAAGVKSVEFVSFDADGKPIQGFSGGQTVAPDFSSIRTDITDPLSGKSESISQYDAQGRLLQTIDTSDGYHNTTRYAYDAQGQIQSIASISISAGGFELRETHLWSYNQQGMPVKMIKIKNDADTTYISFVPDEKGDPGEEKIVHQGHPEPSYYYYFDDDHRLTDIVQYNERARRLLPDYIFEYENGRLATMLVVSEGNTDYQKWYYSYNDDGLKGQDACYSKTKILIARVEYKYSK